ncbi:MAG: hypothetical protein GY711_17575 [bacterium]|nr:hypothetical protein [bacterium]
MGQRILLRALALAALTAPLHAQFIAGYTLDVGWTRGADYDVVESLHFADPLYSDLAVLSDDELLLVWRPQLYPDIYSLGRNFLAMTTLALADGTDGIVVIDDAGLGLIVYGGGTPFFQRVALSGSEWTGVTRLWSDAQRIFGWDPTSRAIRTFNVEEIGGSDGPLLPSPIEPVDFVTLDYDTSVPGRELAVLYSHLLAVTNHDATTLLATRVAAPGDHLAAAPREAGAGDRLIWATSATGTPQLATWNAHFVAETIPIGGTGLQMLVAEYSMEGGLDVLIAMPDGVEAELYLSSANDEFIVPWPNRIASIVTAGDPTAHVAVAAIDMDSDGDNDFVFFHDDGEGRYWMNPVHNEEDVRTRFIDESSLSYEVVGLTVQLSIEVMEPEYGTPDAYRIRHHVQSAPDGPMMPFAEADYVTSTSNPLPAPLGFSYTVESLGDQVDWISISGVMLDEQGAITDVLPTRHLAFGRSDAAANHVENLPYPETVISGDPENGIGGNNGSRVGGNNGGGGPPP